MKKIVLLLEKDFIYCSRSRRMLTILAVNLFFSILVFLKVDPVYKEYVIVLAAIWLLSTASLDLLVYRDIIMNRVSHVLAFGYDIFELMLSKIIFITLLSVFISFLLVLFLRVMKFFFHYDYPSLSNWNFLLLIPIIFFIISLSVFLTFRFQISRPLRIVFIVILLLLNEFREFIAAITDYRFMYIGLFIFFLIADIIIMKFLGSLKNEDIL